jgi:hypothetical protein
MTGGPKYGELCTESVTRKPFNHKRSYISSAMSAGPFRQSCSKFWPRDVLTKSEIARPCIQLVNRVATRTEACEPEEHLD